MDRSLARRLLAALLAGALSFGVAACDTRDEDTTELQDFSEEREEEVDEGVNQGETDEDPGD